VPSVAAARDIRPLATDVVDDMDDSKSPQSQTTLLPAQAISGRTERALSRADVCDGCAR